jgi:hypothetical protein
MSSTLLIVVFFIQLTLYLINSIGAKTINEILWQLYIRLPFGTSQNIKEQGRLRRDVVRLNFLYTLRLRHESVGDTVDFDNRSAIWATILARKDTNLHVPERLGAVVR